jgi:hypothetical protein
MGHEHSESNSSPSSDHPQTEKLQEPADSQTAAPLHPNQKDNPTTPRFRLRDLIPKRDKARADAIASIENIQIGEDELWDSIGIHKALGGNFFRNFTFMLIGAVIGVITLTFVLEQLVPFPAAKGYYDISHELFSFVWLLFDVGTAYGIERFIAEYMIKDKRKMMKYVQFYIWYQMFTGLIQVTLVSIWVLTSVPYGNLAYLSWLLLIINAKQWPGMLGTFNSALKGMQAYDKTIIIDFIGTQGFQFITQVVFIIGGRYWGMANPAIGEMLGLSIGMVFGFYIDDFFSMALSMHYFGKMAEKFGFKARQAWGHDFDLAIVKECLIFGLGLSWAPLIGVGLGLIQLSYALEVVPGYANWKVLASLGAGMASSMNMGGDVNLTSVLSESINNGKKELSSFYLEQSFKYWAFILFAMAGIIIVLLPIVSQVIFIIPSVADQYENALVFIVPGIISLVWDVPIRQLDRLIVMSGKVWFKSTLDMILNVFNLILWISLLNARIWEWGMFGVTILFVLWTLPSKIIRLVAYIIYVQRNIIKIRLSWYQTFGASFFTFIIVFVVGYMFVYMIFLPMLGLMIGWFGTVVGTIITGVFAILVLLIGFMIVVFPLAYALVGGWDEFGLETLRKSYLLSGPSKPFIFAIYKLSIIGSKISPLYNRFKLDWSNAFAEAEDLLRIKRADMKSLQEELEKKGRVNL